MRCRRMRYQMDARCNFFQRDRKRCALRVPLSGSHTAIDLAADALILVACLLDARLPPERRPTCEPLALAGLGALLAATGAQMI